MTYGLGRLQSVMAALSHLVDARGYLMGLRQPADPDLEIVREVDALAAKVKQRRDAAFVSLVDDLGKVTNLAPRRASTYRAPATAPSGTAPADGGGGERVQPG